MRGERWNHMYTAVTPDLSWRESVDIFVIVNVEEVRDGVVPQGL